MGTLFGIAYSKAALKGLASVEPKKVRRQVKEEIDALATNPHPNGCCKVQNVTDGDHEVYRIRQGDYRVLYSVRTSEIIVLDIGHRKHIYR
jgi:mRNA interferase RelE/StbE